MRDIADVVKDLIDVAIGRDDGLEARGRDGLSRLGVATTSGGDKRKRETKSPHSWQSIHATNALRFSSSVRHCDASPERCHEQNCSSS